MTLRRKPVLKYCGLTIVLQNASRYDTFSLLSSTGGVMVNEFLQPEFNLMQCDVRLADDTSPWFKETKCILFCGEYAMHKHIFECRNNVLNEMRGSPFYKDNIPALCTFFPQDAADPRILESKYNENSHDYTGEETDDESEDEVAIKRFSRTKHSNYAFWLKQDIKKCKTILRQGNQTAYRWPTEAEPEYKIFPHWEEVVNVLRRYENQFFEFDMETDSKRNMLCFSFTFWDGKSDKLSCPIYGIPVVNNEYRWAYGSNTLSIILALTRAVEKNIIVAHNGHGFDFPVLSLNNRIAVKRCYDTLVAQQRIYPDVERSLGHCTSLCSFQVFHKDESAHAYMTRDHMMNHLKYCSKDVFTMWLTHLWQSKFALTIPGLVQSIECAQRSIRPYLTSTIQGISYDVARVDSLKNENDRLMMQYIRIIEILVGPLAMEECRKIVKKASGAFPSSTARLRHYFHTMLEYPVVWRNPDTGKPALGKKQLYRLALKHNNPVITFINLYRTVAKEYSALKFKPFRDDKNQLITDEQQTNQGQEDWRQGQTEIESLAEEDIQPL